MEAENNKVTFQEALAQIKRLKESQRKAFEQKRLEQRNGTIRSKVYNNCEDKGIDPTFTRT